MKGKKGLWPFKTQGKTPQPELVLDPDPAGGEALLSPLAGAVVPLESVSDPVFAGKVLGDGLAVEPAEGMLYSPADRHGGDADGQLSCRVHHHQSGC